MHAVSVLRAPCASAVARRRGHAREASTRAALATGERVVIFFDASARPGRATQALRTEA